jgi:2,4-dienoyl-CoA reductase (NADPH2)
VGARVAVVGAGGIGFDVAEFLTAHTTSGTPADLAQWSAEWGVTDPATTRGGLTTPEPGDPVRTVYLLQRKTSKVGAGLGKTSGWVHRSALQMRGVEVIRGASYERIDDTGLHITVRGGRSAVPRVLAVDDVVVCAGQESRRALGTELRSAGAPVHVIGGADLAAELDAKRAIDQGTRLAATL